ncbi:TPA: type IV conjugative transfer system pilin TraA [Klebsiella oxytoca]
MNAVLSVQDTAVSEETKPSFLTRVFNKKKALKVAKVALPVAAVAAFFPDAAMATTTTTATDLMKSGDTTVKGTFGKSSSVVKWVVLAEVIAGGIMYMMTKNVKFLFGFAIISTFITIGMSVAGY